MTTKTTRSSTSQVRTRNPVSRAMSQMKEMSKGKVYQFAYMIRPRGGRPLRPHQLRDMVSATLVTNVLRNQGYGCCEVLFNFPNPWGTPTITVDDSFLGPTDLVLVMGRPPLDDEEWPLKRGMARSHTSLEEKLFACMRPYFRELTREVVALEDSFVRGCPQRVIEKSKILFRMNASASIKRYTGGPDGWHEPAEERTTAAYMVFEPEAWPGGPALLVAFAMGGTETLGWAHLLHTRFAHLVCVPGFVMAEMVTTEQPDWMHDLSYVNDWKVELLTGERPIPRNPGLTQRSMPPRTPPFCASACSA